MSTFNNVNIKDLNQVEEITSGDLLITETPAGTQVIDFKDFVVGPENVSWYSAFVSLSNQVVRSLSGAGTGVQIPNQFEISSNITTSGTNLDANSYIWANTTSTTLTAILPTTASMGQTIRFYDVANTFDNRPFTVARNGHRIQGLEENLTITTEGAAFELTYYNSTYGWRLFPV